MEGLIQGHLFGALNPGRKRSRRVENNLPNIFREDAHLRRLTCSVTARQARISATMQTAYVKGNSQRLTPETGKSDVRHIA